MSSVEPVQSPAATVAGRAEDVSFGDVLKNRHYRNILFAQFFSNVGTWMEMFAIQMYLAQLTGRLDDQGSLGVASQLPVFVFGIVGGLVADRVDRKKMLIITQFLAGFVALGVAAVTMVKFGDPRTPVHLLLGLSAINGLVMAFNFPAWQVLTPRLVPRPQLLKAITLNGIQFNLARVLGPAVAGFLTAGVWMYQVGPNFTATPITMLLIYNAVSFIMMGFVVMTTPSTPPTPSGGEAIMSQFSRAAAYLFTQRGPRMVLLAQVLLSMLAAPLVRLLSLFVIDVYGLSGEAARSAGGTLLAVQGLGCGGGGLTLRYIPNWYPKHHFIPVSVAGLGLSITIFAVTPNLAWGYAAMALCGFFWLWAFNQSWAAMQLLAPDEMRGRVMSIVTTLGFGATAAGVFLAGHGGEWLKDSGTLSAKGATTAAVAGLSIVLMITGVVMMLKRVPEVDGLERAPVLRKPRSGLWNAITAGEHRPKGREDVEAAEVP